MFTKKGLLEHRRHVKCSPTSTATPRKWERARCKHCGRSFHSSNSLRVHVSSQHPTEYGRSPNNVKAHRVPLKHNASPKGGDKNDAPKHVRSQSKHGDKRSPPSAAPQKLKSDLLDVEAMIRNSQDPIATRRVWEDVLRRQQLQKDKSQTLRR